jgi:hypothetical protein
VLVSARALGRQCLFQAGRWGRMKPMIDEHFHVDSALAFLKEIYLRKGTEAAVEAAKDMHSRLLVLWVGPLYKLVGWLLGRIPLNHSPPANITVDAAAVSNGQCGIPDEVLRPTEPTNEIAVAGVC